MCCQDHHIICYFLLFIFSACQLQSRDQPTLLCSSTKYSIAPECVFIDQLCDGNPDCPRGEDENPKLCSVHGVSVINVLVSLELG